MSSNEGLTGNEAISPEQQREFISKIEELRPLLAGPFDKATEIELVEEPEPEDAYTSEAHYEGTFFVDEQEVAVCIDRSDATPPGEPAHTMERWNLYVYGVQEEAGDTKLVENHHYEVERTSSGDTEQLGAMYTSNCLIWDEGEEVFVPMPPAILLANKELGAKLKRGEISFSEYHGQVMAAIRKDQEFQATIGEYHSDFTNQRYLAAMAIIGKLDETTLG